MPEEVVEETKEQRIARLEAECVTLNEELKTMSTARSEKVRERLAKLKELMDARKL